MDLTGWGRYPVLDAEVSLPATIAAARSIVDGSVRPFRGIARGMGRSYGDSALAQHVICTSHLDYFISFDTSMGVLKCAAGVSLGDILRIFVPRGWFLPVTPGTKYVSVGGAVASDVHGKNHHKEGSFCDHVSSIELLLSSGELLTCSRYQNTELFQATCGGMGLTGVITQAEIRLRPIQSAYVRQRILKTRNLKDTLDTLEAHGQCTYSVAWIDCLARKNNFGRSLVMLGEHADTGGLEINRQQPYLAVPIDMPGFAMGRTAVRMFNTLYYARAGRGTENSIVHYDKYFYPLDSIGSWNRIYGKNGFMQYQFAIPKSAGYPAMVKLLRKIVDSGRGSFLAVLKLLGPGNNNYLSFPIQGYTLALDFRCDRGLLSLFREMDRIVLDYGGRLYLSKDACMEERTFKQAYGDWEKLAELREKYHAGKVFRSRQSDRLGI